jgi:hypothetical protein
VLTFPRVYWLSPFCSNPPGLVAEPLVLTFPRVYWLSPF